MWLYIVQTTLMATISYFFPQLILFVTSLISSYTMKCHLFVHVCSSTGALLSHILEPLYLSTITIGQSPDGAQPDGFCIESNVVKVLGARLSCISRKFPDPFKPNKVGFHSF